MQPAYHSSASGIVRPLSAVRGGELVARDSLPSFMSVRMRIGLTCPIRLSEPLPGFIGVDADGAGCRPGLPRVPAPASAIVKAGPIVLQGGGRIDKASTLRTAPPDAGIEQFSIVALNRFT